MLLRRTWYLAGALLLLTASVSAAAPRGMVRIEGGSFRPLYAHHGRSVVAVNSFALDTVPVSQASFLEFLRRQGVRSGAQRTAAQATRQQAAAYCRARGARLPTIHEWEYVARASEKARDATADAAFKQRALELALSPRDGRFVIGSGMRNVWGVRDMHGGLPEWTAEDAHTRHTMNCAQGVVQTGDASDYAAFMRYAFRHGADAQTKAGFRCAV